VTKQEEKEVCASVLMHPEMYTMAKRYAKSGRMSFSAFANQAIAAYMRRWKDPLKMVMESQSGSLKEEKYAGWICTQSACQGAPASECLRPGSHSQAMWYHTETDVSGYRPPEEMEGELKRARRAKAAPGSARPGQGSEPVGQESEQEQETVPDLEIAP
jgi:hypothetical protein